MNDSDPARDRPKPRTPNGLLGMLALVVVIELIISGRRLDFTTIWADDWRRSAEASKRHARGRDVLIFGDSLVKFSILPRQVEATSGLRSYNLALNAGTMPSAYFMLRQTLERGARPRAIVADFCTLMIPDRPIHSIRMYPEMATVRDLFDLASTSGDLEFLSCTLLGKFIPSCKCRHEIRESIKAALDGRRASPWPAQSIIWATWKDQFGAQPMPCDGLGGAPNPGLAFELAPKGWECDAINATYAEKFLDLARSKQIPVYWLIPPLHPDLEALRVYQGSRESYTRFVKATLARHPEVVVIDAREAGYDRSLYIDPIHLGRPGAVALSTEVAKLLKERIGKSGEGPQWVALPPREGRTSPIATGGEVGRRK
jgi:hypothetical protein